jgi:hypothetical protein
MYALLILIYKEIILVYNGGFPINLMIYWRNSLKVLHIPKYNLTREVDTLLVSIYRCSLFLEVSILKSESYNFTNDETLHMMKNNAIFFS